MSAGGGFARGRRPLQHPSSTSSEGMKMSNSARVPTTVTLEEMLGALSPLWDLLNVSPMEIVGDVQIVRPTSTDREYEIRFSVVATPDDVAAVEFPSAVRAQGHPQGDEFAIFTHHISVAVV